MSSVATATMSDVSMSDTSNTSSMGKYYASKIGELSEVSFVILFTPAVALHCCIAISYHPRQLIMYACLFNY
jgi:hypothetical protein